MLRGVGRWRGWVGHFDELLEMPRERLLRLMNNQLSLQLMEMMRRRLEKVVMKNEAVLLFRRFGELSSGHVK